MIFQLKKEMNIDEIRKKCIYSTYSTNSNLDSVALTNYGLFGKDHFVSANKILIKQRTYPGAFGRTKDLSVMYRLKIFFVFFLKSLFSFFERCFLITEMTSIAKVPYFCVMSYLCRIYKIPQDWHLFKIGKDELQQLVI